MEKNKLFLLEELKRIDPADKELYAAVSTLFFDDDIRKVKVKGIALIVEDEYGYTTFQNVDHCFDTEQEARKSVRESKEEIEKAIEKINKVINNEN